MFYTNVAKKGTKLLVRQIHDDGSRLNHVVDYKPTVFINSQDPNSKWKTLFNKPVEPVEIESMTEVKKFVDQYAGVDGFSIYGHDFPFNHQYLNINFPGEIQYKKELMSIYVVDIETTTERGFPKIDNPVEEILIITMTNVVTGEVEVFSRKEFNINPEWVKTPKEKITINVFENEKTLLEQWVSFWKMQQIDIITGWNIQFFDLPYLVARLNAICNKKLAKQLSPFNSVRESTKYVKNLDKDIPVVHIDGVAILDYLALYQKFTYTKRESYALDHIAYCEVKANKLDHSEFPTFKSFYEQGWDKFCNYNIVDTTLVVDIDYKIKLIDLAMMIAYTAKINFDEVYSPVKTWDAILHNYLWYKNKCVSIKKSSEKEEQYEGAFVKDPVVGMHESLASFDAASLYPSIMQAWNISPETLVFVDDELDVGVDKWLSGDVVIPEQYYKKNLTVACNGACFTHDFKGVIGENIDYFMDLRKSTKKEMLKYKQDKENSKEGSAEYIRLNNLVSYLDVKQQAVKILNNSLYGACGNSYFRYFDINLARAITTMGQYIIQFVANGINEFGYKKCGATKDLVIYMDTDSTYICLDEILKKNIKEYSSMDVHKKINIMDRFCDTALQPVITKTTDKLQKFFNTYRNTISFKREALSDRGVFVAKKRYILNVYDMEGVRYHEPEAKIMGLEMIKSSTPQVVRDKLHEAVSVILYGSEAQMKTFVTEYKDVFCRYSPNEIAFPRGVNGLEEYAAKPIYRKGTPENTRSALIHNHLVKKLGLENKYKLINTGDKIKFVKLMENSPYRENVIGFVGELPQEFRLHDFVDYDTMFDKTFLDPLNGIIELLGWRVNEHASLEDFFC